MSTTVLTFLKDTTLKLFGLYLTEYEKLERDKIKDAISHKAKYGGKIIITPRGGVRTEFKTKEGEVAYYRDMRKEINDKYGSAISRIMEMHNK